MRFPAKKSLLSPTPRVHADYFPESPYGRTYTDVITKISRIASLLIILVMVKTKQLLLTVQFLYTVVLQYYFLLISDYKIYKAILFQFLDRFFLIFHEKVSPSHARRNKFPGFPGWIDCIATHKAKEAVSTLKRHLCPRLITLRQNLQNEHFSQWPHCKKCKICKVNDFSLWTFEKLQNLLN